MKPYSGRPYLYQGEWLTIREIAERTDIKEATLRYRLRRGMSIEDAISETPPFKKPRKPKLGGRALGTKYLYEGEWLLVSEIAKRTGLSISTLYRRRCGSRIMSTNEVRHMPHEPYVPLYLTVKGETKTVQQWAISRGISYAALRKRIKLGWPIERALASPTNRTQRAINRRIIKRMLAGFVSDHRGHPTTFPTCLGTGGGRHAADFQCKSATGA